MIQTKFHFLLLAALYTIFLTCGCDRNQQEDTAGKGRSGETGIVSDEPLAEFQKELLDLAFETATAIPVDPHIKDRSRAQQAVVEACLELEQPARACKFIARIDNWRRGLGYAKLAFYFAQRDRAKKAHYYLDLAKEVAAGAEITRQWRRDRIRAKIAQTYILLRETGRAEQFKQDLAGSETGKLQVAKAAVSDEDSFYQRLEELDALVAQGDLDITKNALRAYAGLFDRFYDDEKRRSLAEQRIKTSSAELQVFMRLDFLIELADFALDHNDKEKSLELVNEAQLLLDASRWMPQDYVSRAAQLAKLRFRAGDVEKARAEADAARALFNNRREGIVNIYRGAALRPLAEAYQSMADTETALSVYKQAVEEGVENSNSRPRAQDLSATCCSMALYNIEPDAELWGRIRTIGEGLGKPW